MIDYEHGSPAVAVLAGVLGGQAQFQRAQDQLALQQAQLDLQSQRLVEDARQSDMARQLQERLALLNDSRAQQQMGFSLARDRADAAYGMQRDVMNFQQQLAANAMQQQAGLDRLGYQAMIDQAKAGQAAEIDWMMNAGDQANVAAKESLSNYRQMQLTPEGERLRSEWDARIRAFQAKQGELRPQAYAQGLNQILQGMAQAGIQDFEIKDLTPEEIMQRQVIWQDENNMLIQQPDGKLTLQGKVMPKTPPAPKPEKPVDPAEVPIDTPFGEKLKPAEAQRRMSDYRRDAIAEIKAEHEAAVMAGTAEEGSKAKFSDEDILERIRKRIEAENKWWDEQMGGSAEQSDAGSEQAPYAPPTIDSILAGGQSANTPLQAPWAPGSEQAPADQTLPPPPFVGVPEQTQWEPSVQQAPPQAPPQAAPQPEPMAPPPRYAMQTIEPKAAAKNPEFAGWFKYLDGVYFKANTPEEAANLPPGTQVVLPDGRIATKK
jgi:hypothetical protein